MISYVLKNDRYEMKVPALTFGAAGFERNDCDDVYFEFLDKYVELGGWCIDTARVYCDWLENGHDSSEGVIGRWLKARNNRDKICIAKRAATLKWVIWTKAVLAGKSLQMILKQA